MGLDITHYKTTLIRPVEISSFPGNYMTEEEFEDFDVPFTFFEKHIQDIDYPQSIRTLILPKRENEIEEAKAFLHKWEYDFLFHRDKKSLEKSILEFEKRWGLSDLARYTWETDMWTGIEYLSFSKKRGFYFEKAGYQRKGMNEKFRERFQRDTICNFTGRDDFEYALKCVDYCWASDTEEDVELRRTAFREDFLEKYEEGVSWMELG